MKFTPVSGYDRELADSGVCQGGGVCVACVDVAGLSGGGLQDRPSEIGRAESKLGAFKAEVLAELSRRDSKSAAERAAREQLQSSRRDAQRDVEAAERLSALEETSQALGSGEIPVGHARLIARAASEGPIDQTFLVEAARHQGYDQFAKTLRRNQQEMSDDDGQSIHDRQHKNRTARAFTSRETGMFILSGEFDPVAGAKIDTALAIKERELWNAEGPKSRRTPQQRMADALAELILEPEKGKAQGTTLMVVADYDVINQELINARLADGTPIPMDELVRLACDADLLPGVFRAATQEMNLGRRRRTASDRQRAALIYRDKQCIGCGATAHRCFAHHVQFWRHGGPTDLANLVLVCNKCHHNIHDEHWQVSRDSQTGHWNTQPPPDPFPDGRVDTTQPFKRNPVLIS